LLSTVFVLVLLTLIVLLQRRRVGRSFRYSIALGSLVLGATLIVGCGAGSGSGGGGAGNTGTTPGSYTVTVYAFTENNMSNGANSNADARATIQLTVN